jgi:SNF2 family DNA or RNA helicase
MPVSRRPPARRSPQQKRGWEDTRLRSLPTPATPTTALAGLSFFAPAGPKRDATQLGWALFGARGLSTLPQPAHHERLQWELVVRSPTVRGIALRRDGDTQPCCVVASDSLPYFDALLATVPSRLLRLSFMAVRSPASAASSSETAFYVAADIWAPPSFHLRLKRILEPLGARFSQCTTSRPRVHTDLLSCLGTTTTTLATLASPAPHAISSFATRDTLTEFFAAVSAEAAATDPEPVDPIGITTELRPYQRAGLAWMLQREATTTTSSKTFAWARGWLPAAPSGYMNEWNRETAAGLPTDDVAGGILADDMGLGKSIQILSLITTTRVRDRTHGSGRQTTLIVCPLSVLGHWESQAERHVAAEHRLRVCRYHEADRLQYSAEDLAQFDIVLTTYATLAKEYESAKKLLQHADNLYRNAAEPTSLDACVNAFPPMLPAPFVQAHYRKARKTGSESRTAVGGEGNGDDDDDNNNVDHSRGQPPAAVAMSAPLFELTFHRVVLDEGHIIRRDGTRQSCAARAVHGCYRWVLSGTLIMNNITDAFAVLQFLRVAPLDRVAHWNALVKDASSANEDPSTRRAVQIVQLLFRTLMLRRLKSDRLPNGDLLVQLPPKTIRACHVTLAPHERAQYGQLEQRVRDRVHQLSEQNAIGKSYMLMLELLLRLRQMCVDSSLLPKMYLDILKAETSAAASGSTQRQHQAPQPSTQAEEFLAEQAAVEVCTSCKQSLSEASKDGGPPSLLACGHFYCDTCLGELRSGSNCCEDCRDPILAKHIIRIKLSASTSSSSTPSVHSFFDAVSSKTQRILADVKTILPTGDKIVIISQWPGYLRRMDSYLRESFPGKVRPIQLDGSMTATQRDTVLEQFRTDAAANVFLLSLQAGAVGIDLTPANHVLVVDPWWNPAIEDQGIDRVHRIGQTKPVTVHRYICVDSIEERLVALQERKRAIAQVALSTATNISASARAPQATAAASSTSSARATAATTSSSALGVRDFMELLAG